MPALFSNVDQKTKTSQAGFSLLELSVVLAVMGIIGVSSLSLMTGRLDSAHRKVTREHQELILKSLANYAVTSGRLPCPSADLLGQPRESCAAPAQAVGYLPFHALGLPEKLAKDGWGHPMRYAVAFELTTVDIINSHTDLEVFCKTPKTTLVVTSNNGTFPRPGSKDPLAVVVYSQGLAFPTPRSDTERQNDAPHLTFIDAPLSVQENRPHGHLLVWATRDNLMNHYASFSCPTYLKMHQKTGAPFSATLAPGDTLAAPGLPTNDQEDDLSWD